MYRVAKASGYLVIIKAGVRDIKLAKKAWILPGQSCTVFDLSLMNYTFEGIIEGETCVLAASITMEEFGLLICNANVKQLVDVPGHEYFSYLGQKTQMEAANQAKTKVIAIQRSGEGEKEGIKVRSEMKVFKNERQAEVAQANSELAKKKAAWTKVARVAEVEAAKVVALREAELQGEVEKMNALTTTEKLKAEFF
ncbi:unnamed protein product [Vicia faba]|uniref:Flotillin-like n=1 Tax=Vicia faba TaxID=3906 RepID=A0AAV0ZPT9_VICFA|nr:unnamed protein product [Vicia faba]